MPLIRWFLGKLILALDALFAPTPLQRPAERQAQVDEALGSLALYQFETCPFCVKVRRAMRRMNLNIELRDVREVKAYADELVVNGGHFQVPCLRIKEPDGPVRWMYESSDIVAYLEERFSS